MKKIIGSILLVCMIALSAFFVTTHYLDENYKHVTVDNKANVVLDKKQKQDSTVTAEPTDKATPEETPEVKKTTHKVTLLAVGDDLIHTQIIGSAKQGNGTYNFDEMFQHLKKDIENADVSVINQETVLGGASLGYSGYPRFNSPTQVGDAIRKAGFDVVLHATNHTIDKGIQGIQNTIDYWKKYKNMTVLGIHSSKEDQNTVKVVEKNGIRIAMLNYTFGLNGLSISGDKRYMVDVLEESKVRSDIQKAKKQSDFVVVFPHWGTEYLYQPTQMQKNWVDIFREEGVDLVIGTHPHVIEPVKWYEGKDGHKMLVYYSLGNYISNQTETPRMLGAMAKVTIEKAGDEPAKIEDSSVTPLVTHYETSLHTVYKLSEYSDELARRHGVLRKDPSFSLEALKNLANQVFGSWS